MSYPPNQPNPAHWGLENYGAAPQFSMGQPSSFPITSPPSGLLGLNSDYSNMSMPSMSTGAGFDTLMNYGAAPAPLAFNPGFDGGFGSGLSGFAPSAATGADGGMFGNMLGANGWGGLALGAVQGIANGLMGMKQYNLAKDTLKQNKKQFEMNFGVQKELTNQQIGDRNVARAASREGSSNPYQQLKTI